ncbi:MAG: hypothetical protein JXR58_04970 [Bacteroidales bacterium]|nr:hypothetical protein [Bacteroidales bacterium]
MKRVYILFVALLISGFSFSQNLTKGDLEKIQTKGGKMVLPKAPVNTGKSITNRGAKATYITENFDAAVPPGTWTVSNLHATSVWFAGNPSASSFTTIDPTNVQSALHAYIAADCDEKLITPAINATSATALNLTFWAGYSGSWMIGGSQAGGTGADLRVIGSLDGTTWTTLWSYSDTHIGTESWAWEEINLDLQSTYGGTTFYLAFQYYGYDGDLGAFDGIQLFDLANDDAGVTAITSPTNASSCSLTASENVTVTVTNFGINPITSCDVSYTINGGTPVTETVSTTIASGATYDYTFTATADLSTVGEYTIEAYTSLSSDGNAANDGFSVDVTNADATLTIDVLTDTYSSETSWEIYNSAGELVAEKTSFTASSHNITNVCLIADDCYTFYLYDSYGDGTAPSGTLSLSWNGTVIGGFTSAESNFGSEWVRYSIGDGCEPIDAQLKMITTPSYVLPGMVNITGQILNMGTDNITSYDVTYTVDGGASSAIYTVTGVNLATGDTHNFTHDVQWNATLGAHDINVVIGNVNTTTDGNLINNSLTKTITGVSVAPQKRVIGEEGTGTWCGWCVRGHSPFFTKMISYANVETANHCTFVIN